MGYTGALYQKFFGTIAGVLISFGLLSIWGILLGWMVSRIPKHNNFKKKNMNASIKNLTVGQLVTEHYQTALVFKAYGIDFCCGGKRTVEAACASKQVDVLEFEKKIREVLTQPHSGPRFNDWSNAFLIDYIINNHHSYVRQTLPELLFLAEKVARVHGEAHPELLEMRQLVHALNSELLEHIDKEEKESFPLIKALETEGFEGKVNQILLDELEDEHEVAGGLMKQLEAISNAFTPPEGACTSYTVYFKLLQEFQDDLHKHVHLENNVLFPKVELQALAAS